MDAWLTTHRILIDLCSPFHHLFWGQLSVLVFHLGAECALCSLVQLKLLLVGLTLVTMLVPGLSLMPAGWTSVDFFLYVSETLDLRTSKRTLKSSTRLSSIA